MNERAEIGPLVAAVGAVLLFVSLFLDWFKPSLSAFTAFEALDLLLAALALAVAVAALAPFAGVAAPPALSRALPAMSVVALVVVASQAIDHPPAGWGREADGGLWLGLTGAVLMAAGGLLAKARVSLNVAPREPTASQPGSSAPGGPAAPPSAGAHPAERGSAGRPPPAPGGAPDPGRTRPIGEDPEAPRFDPPPPPPR